MKLKKNIIYFIFSLFAITAGLIIGLVTLKDGAKRDVSDIFTQSYPNVQGKLIALESLKGEYFTIINFWATWCAPCIEEMPMLSNFHEENQSKGIKVIALAIDNKRQIQKFLNNKNLKQPVLITGAEGAKLTEFLGSRKNALPFTALIGPKNKLLKTKMGKISENEIKSWVFDEFKEHLADIR